MIDNIHIKATTEQKAAWQAAAAKDGRTLSGWIRVVLDGAADNPNPYLGRKFACGAPDNLCGHGDACLTEGPHREAMPTVPEGKGSV